MKKLFSLLSILLLLGLFPTIYGQENYRTAVIVDQSGTLTELETLSIALSGGLGNKYFEPYTKLAVITETFEVLFPVSNLISIEYIGDGIKNKRKFEVSYYWMGEEKLISGNLVDITLKGKSDFGSLSLSSNELKQLRVSQIPDEIKQKEEFHSDGYITLRDGTKLEFGVRTIKHSSSRQTKYALQRHVGYPARHKREFLQSAEDERKERIRYEWINTVDNLYDEGIAFNRGESQAYVKFKDVRSIEFEGENDRDILITVKNGKSTKAQINASRERDFHGLVGVSEIGEFYIERKNIRNIYFN